MPRLTTTNTDSDIITYTSSNLNVATVTGAIFVNVIGVGTATITATQVATANFNAPTPKTTTFTVAKITPTFLSVFSIPTKIYNQSPFRIINLISSNTTTPILFTSSNLNVATISYDTNTNLASGETNAFINIVGAGVSTITAYQLPTTIYNAPVEITTTFTVTKAQAVFSSDVWNIPTKTYGDPPFLITGLTSTNTETPIVYTNFNFYVASISGSTVTIIGNGFTTITASQASSANYDAPLNNPTASFNVVKANAVFSPSNWSLDPKELGDAPFEITNITSSNTTTPIYFTSSNTDVATIFGKIVTIVGVGTSIITAFQDNTLNYDSPPAKTTTLIVGNSSDFISDICFLAGTPIQTDQGVVCIEALDPRLNTIGKNRIVGVTKTISIDAWLVEFQPHALGLNKPTICTVMSMNHKVEHQDVMMPAKEIVNGTTIKRIPYNRETLYNVLQDHHGTMLVNNLVCETLHPDNLAAKLFRLLNHLPREEQANHVRKYNAFCETNKIYDNTYENGVC